METIIKVILELGVCEIIYFKDLSYKISIAEYNKVSNSFLNKNEVGLINGILDQIAKNINIKENVEKYFGSCFLLLR